jgi:hypothetical protein
MGPNAQAGAFSWLGDKLMELAGRKREREKQGAEAARLSPIRDAELIARLSNTPGLTMERPTSLDAAPRRTTPAMEMLESSTPRLPSVPGLPGADNIGRALMQMAVAGQNGYSPATINAPPERAPVRRLRDIPLSDGQTLPLYYDPSQTREGVDAAAVETKKLSRLSDDLRNRAAFDRTRTLHPDAASTYAAETDFVGMVPKVEAAAGQQRELVAGGLPADEAHSRAFHDFSLSGERRAAEAHTREGTRLAIAQEDQGMQRADRERQRVIDNATGAAERYATQAGVTEGLLDRELRKNYPSLSYGERSGIVAKALGKGVTAKDSRTEELRSGITSKYGKPARPEHQVLVDELVKGKTPEQIKREIRRDMTAAGAPRARIDALLVSVDDYLSGLSRY